MNAIITLKEYLGKNKTFVIPNYQRGYIWGKNRPGEKNSVEAILDDLLIKYTNNVPVFLQGFTVTEKNDEIILVDGQQRTTFLFLLLKYLKYSQNFIIRYDIRQTSADFLNNIKFDDSAIKEDNNEQFQDIFFFKKTLRIIKEKLNELKDPEELEKFKEFLLNNIKFLYINIPERLSSRVFTMMNGSRAEMIPEEIIKAEILRLASINNDVTIDYSIEWENNMLRSRYAREWDKWLHWWNREDVQKFYRCDNTMGLLISAHAKSKTDKTGKMGKADKLTFEFFKNECLKKGRAIEAKSTFNELRRLQKRFEDAFYDERIHNMIGAIMRLSPDKEDFIQYYFVKVKKDQLDSYYKLAFLGMTHLEIVNFLENRLNEECHQKFTEKYQQTLDRLRDDFIYTTDNKEYAFRLLLRLNIDEDNKQNDGHGRYFDFSIWDNGMRSLEHIMPKSRVKHYDASEDCLKGGDNERHDEPFYYLCDRNEIIYNDQRTTEHSIGNLVLLYKNDNSQFSNKKFTEKKNYFFDTQINEYFKSRHLLHTIYIFANSDWSAEDIAKNKVQIIESFIKYYKEFGI